MNCGTGDNRCAFRFPDALVLLILSSMLTCLLAPALAQSLASSKNNYCINNAKQIAIALQNHHDTRRTFPLASTRLITSKPGHAGDADAAGYSWLVMLLPYMEETLYWDQLVRSSDKLLKDPFDPEVTSKDGANGVPSRGVAFNSFLCPSFLAGRLDDAPGTEKRSAIEKLTKSPAVSNYHGFAGSHFYSAKGLGRLLSDDKLTKQADGRVSSGVIFEGDGVLPFPRQAANKMRQAGISFQRIIDGTSRTLMFAETIEPEFASWLDGQVTWFVAAWPANPDVPSLIQLPGKGEQKELGWTDSQLPKNWASLGRPCAVDKPNAGIVYLPGARWSGGKDRKWGPSSYHGHEAVHGFCDASVKMIKDDIDKNVYLHLVTRNGREIDDVKW
jgi:hypothetical protein